MSLFVDIEKTAGNFRLKVSFEADREIFALLGASGSGKSMTLKCIAGIEKPDRGLIVLDGVTLFDSDKRIGLPPQKRRAGYLFQQYALFPNMTVRENILCGIREKDRRAREDRAEEVIRTMRLSGLESLRPSQLSGGQQQRTALARILAGDPEMLMLDEPFSALDTYLRADLEREVMRILRRYGKTVLLVSHDRDEVYRMADRIAVLDDGRLTASGTRKEVFDDPGSVSAARITGCGNVADAVPLEEPTKLFVPAWGIVLETGRSCRDITAAGIRAGDIRLCQEKEGAAGHLPEGKENTFRCRVDGEIENPFSYTILLRAEGDLPGGEKRKDLHSFAMELDKAEWEREREKLRETQPLGGRETELDVRIPPEAVLLLRK